jgi:hypothetical protein
LRGELAAPHDQVKALKLALHPSIGSQAEPGEAAAASPQQRLPRRASERRTNARFAPLQRT